MHGTVILLVLSYPLTVDNYLSAPVIALFCTNLRSVQWLSKLPSCQIDIPSILLSSFSVEQSDTIYVAYRVLEKYVLVARDLEVSKGFLARSSP